MAPRWHVRVAETHMRVVSPGLEARPTNEPMRAPPSPYGGFQVTVVEVTVLVTLTPSGGFGARSAITGLILFVKVYPFRLNSDTIGPAKPLPRATQLVGLAQDTVLKPDDEACCDPAGMTPA